MGGTDFKQVPEKKEGEDPSVPEEKLPAVKFTYDKELGEMVFCGHVNQVEH